MTEEKKMRGPPPKDALDAASMKMGEAVRFDYESVRRQS